jgi:chitinase
VSRRNTKSVTREARPLVLESRSGVAGVRDERCPVAPKIAAICVVFMNVDGGIKFALTKRTMRSEAPSLISFFVLFGLSALPGCASSSADGGLTSSTNIAAASAPPSGAGTARGGAAPCAGAAGMASAGAAGGGGATQAASSLGGAGGDATRVSQGGDVGSAAGAGDAVAGAGGTASADGAAGRANVGVTPPPKVVAYLPNYDGSYRTWASKIDFSKMTHLNLAFTSANSENDWDMGASDADVKVLVDAAHAAGVKVLASLGGGDDHTVVARYKEPGNDDALVGSLDSLLKRLNLDGADVDIEDPANLNGTFSSFAEKLIATLHPEGKLATSALAQYLIEESNYSQTTLDDWDFINVMIYTNKLSDFSNELTWFTDAKGVAKAKLAVGVGFFGTDDSGTGYSYSEIIKADGTAWSKNQTKVGNQIVNYTGVDLMTQLATLSKSYGGIMFWEYTQDVSGVHSLWKAIQSTL